MLRKESGAVISDQEFAREERKFFPIIGDKDPIIKQKARGRERAFENLSKQSKGVFRVQFENPQIFKDQPSALSVTTPQAVTDQQPQGLAQLPSAQPAQPGALPGAQPAQAQFTEGQTATNPQTGQTLIFRNGQWVAQ